MSKYPPDEVGPDDDDGTMPDNVQTLRDAVVGHRIVSAERGVVSDAHMYSGSANQLVLTLDNGRRVRLIDEGDCCAYTELEAFVHNPDLVEHVITGIETEGGYETWHVYADYGDVLTLKVGWSCGNPFYYAYGFRIRVEDVEEEKC